jgi:FkbM family methyltransferase
MRAFRNEIRTRARLLSKLSKRDLLRGRRALKVDGSVMELPGDRAWAFRDGDYYEKAVRHWFVRVLAALREPVVYDVGANYGYYTLVAARRAVQVYAFEPASATFEVLERNISRNVLRNVELFHLAVSDQTGSADIHLYSSSGSNTLTERTPLPNHGLRYLGREAVRTVRLDEFVPAEQLAPPSLLKIDTEGSELRVLQGSRGILDQHRPVLFVEYSGAIGGDAGYSCESLVEELAPLEYKLYALADDAGEPELYPLAELADGDVDFVIALPAPLAASLIRATPTRAGRVVRPAS